MRYKYTLWIVLLIIALVVMREFSPVVFTLFGSASPHNEHILMQESEKNSIDIDDINEPVLIYDPISSSPSSLVTDASRISAPVPPPLYLPSAQSSPTIHPTHILIPPSLSSSSSSLHISSSSSSSSSLSSTQLSSSSPLNTQQLNLPTQQMKPTHFDRSQTYTSIVGGMKREAVHISSETKPSHISVLSARIKRVHDETDGWDALSLLVVMNSLNDTKQKEAGCLSWVGNHLHSKAELIWKAQEEEEEEEDPIPEDIPRNSNDAKKATRELMKSVEIDGICSPGWQKQKLWSTSTTTVKKKTTKTSVVPLGQLCYGFIDFPLSNMLSTNENEVMKDAQQLSSSLKYALQTSRVSIKLNINILSLIEEKEEVDSNNHITSSQNVMNKWNGIFDRSKRPSNKSGEVFLNFQLEARERLSRPKVSMCLDSLFGSVAEALLEFLSFQRLIGVERIFVFDETHNQSTSEVLNWLNIQAKEEEEEEEQKLHSETTKRDQQVPESETSSSRMLPTYQGPFLQVLPFSIGQFVFGSPQPPVNIGYGARELTMTYCVAESPSEALLSFEKVPPLITSTNTATKHKTNEIRIKKPSKQTRMEEINDLGWLFIDVGMDEFLDCRDLAPLPLEKSNKLLRNRNSVSGRPVNKRWSHIGELVDSFANRFNVETADEITATSTLSPPPLSRPIGKKSSGFFGNGAKCTDNKCIELCFMRFKFGSTFAKGFEPKGYRHNQHHENDSSSSSIQQGSIEESYDEQSLLSTSLRMEKHLKTYIGHRQGKCMLRSSLALDLNFTIEVHGTLRQPGDKQCEKRNRNTNSHNQPHTTTTTDISSTSKQILGNLSTPIESIPPHCKYGAQFRYSETSPEFGPVCRFNHYRPQFFTKCANNQNSCTDYRGQRSVYVFDTQIESSLNWTIPYLRNQKQKFWSK